MCYCNIPQQDDGKTKKTKKKLAEEPGSIKLFALSTYCACEDNIVLNTHKQIKDGTINVFSFRARFFHESSHVISIFS